MIKRVLWGDSAKRVYRTFIITTLALWLPDLFGWLNDLTEWARNEGSTPFPDASGLAYLGVSAVVAGVVAAVNAVWNGTENIIGKGMMREVPQGRHEADS
jgi:hypothetical protein